MHMPHDKTRLVRLVSSLIEARTSARKKALVGKDPATEADWMAWENAKSELVPAIVDYARQHSLPAGLLPRWLDLLSKGEVALGKLDFRDSNLDKLRSEFEGLPDPDASAGDAMMIERCLDHASVRPGGVCVRPGSG